MPRSYSMIDLHSHVLPGIDDGARDLSEARAMLECAVADGIALQVLTPHLHPHRYGNSPARLHSAFTAFRAALGDEAPRIELRQAAEVRASTEIISLVERDEVPWLGEWSGERVLLLEFPYNNLPLGSAKLVEWLRDRSIRPLIAHPERTLELQRAPEKLRPFVEAGCLLQLTAGSLTGVFGVPAYRLAVALLEQGCVTVLASDCHNMQDRSPLLSPGVAAAAGIIGTEAARDLVTKNPGRILDVID
jgi:protein-tyrosine phosphatase